MRLSDIQSDYESTYDELQQALEDRGETFKSIFPGETGNLLLRLLAATSSQLNYRIEQSVLNSYLHTAHSASSIYILSDMLGYLPKHKIGATTTARFKIDSSRVQGSQITVPAGTRYLIENEHWYTTQAYSFPASAATIDIPLKQGRLYRYTYQSRGSVNETINVVGDYDIENLSCSHLPPGSRDAAARVQLTLADSFLSSGAAADTYKLRSSIAGGLIIVLGDGVYGALIPTGNEITYSYYRNTGIAGNGVGAQSAVLEQSEELRTSAPEIAISGETTTTSANGLDEEQVETIKANAPRFFAANNRAVRRDDYLMHLTNHELVAAAQVWGEYEQISISGLDSSSEMNKVHIVVVGNAIRRVDASEQTAVQFTTINTSNRFKAAIPAAVDATALQGSVVIRSELEEGTQFVDSAGTGTFFRLDRATLGWDLNQSIAWMATAGSASLANLRDTSATTHYEAGVAATTTTPVVITQGSANASERLLGVRLRSASPYEEDARAQPRVVSVWGTTAASFNAVTDLPNIGKQSDTKNWERLTPEVIIPPLVPGDWSEVLTIRTRDVRYITYALRITDRYGSADSTKLAGLQFYVTTTPTADLPDQAAREVLLNAADGVSRALNVGKDFYLSYDSGKLSAAQLTQIQSHIEQYKNFTTQIELSNIQITLIDIKLRVHCQTTRGESDIITDIRSALIDKYNPVDYAYRRDYY